MGSLLALKKVVEKLLYLDGIFILNVSPDIS